MSSLTCASPAPFDHVMSTVLSIPSALDSSAGWGHPPVHRYRFETVPGFFAQDIPTTDALTFDFITSNFGLLGTWHAFKESVAALNEQAPAGTSYRVLYLARHGEGYHNVAEAKYGTAAWDSYWSKLNGDGTLVWGPDPLLTPVGVGQAQAAGAAWATQTAAGAPRPEAFYTSPFTRAADTLRLTFPVTDPAPAPVMLEGLRETIGVHTCDMRAPRAFIRARYPGWTFERGFSEADVLWGADVRETAGAQQARVHDALVQILENDTSAYISITAHSGTISAALRALDHRPFPLHPGGMIPVVVKATQIS